MRTDITVLGVQEYTAIADGLVALDLMVKEAPVEVLSCVTVTPGKYIIIITGDEASVDASLKRARREFPQGIMEELFIPHLHTGVGPALLGEIGAVELDALGVIESFSVAAGIEAADVCAKRADVRLLKIGFGSGMGGKATVRFTGRIGEVQAALEAGKAVVEAKGRLCRSIIIPRPHGDIESFLVG
ncbi:MAG: BMC domain-containing protein [Spirochaetales bacterium]|nr:BMC domain-containing protein [Spirochaetales bacterium]